MKKTVLIASLMIFAALQLTPFTVSANELVFKMATWGPKAHYIGGQRDVWLAAVNEKLAGKLKIVEYPGGQLYGPKEMHMALAKGSVEMGLILQPAMLAMAPILQGVYLPFAYDSVDQAAKAYQGESREIIEKAMEEKRIKMIYPAYTDGVQIFSNKKNIDSMEDFNGMRILSTSPIITEIFSKLGAAPDASIPQTEQYMALKRGVSDAMAQAVVGGFFQKSYEVAPYVTKTDMSFPTLLLCMNLKKWESLPKDVQDVLLEEGKIAEASSLAASKGWEAKFTGEMEKLGATVTRIPDDVRAQVKEVSKEVWEKWANDNGPDAQRLLELNRDL